MKIITPKIVLLLLFCFHMIEMYGQDAKRKYEKKDRIYAKQESVYLSDKLKLTKQQTALLDEVEISLIAKRNEAKKISNGVERKQKYADIESWHTAQLKSILTKQQYSAYQTLVENARIRMQTKNAEFKNKYGPKG